MTPEDRAMYMAQHSSRFYGNRSGAVPETESPSHFFHLVAEVCGYLPHLYDETARQPVLRMLACLNDKRKRERLDLERDLEIAKSLAGAGVASFFGRKKR